MNGFLYVFFVYVDFGEVVGYCFFKFYMLEFYFFGKFFLVFFEYFEYLVVYFFFKEFDVFNWVVVVCWLVFCVGFFGSIDDMD